jgi:putative ABC transport system substrate-binding protein
MRRRTFIEGLGLATAWPMLAHAQQSMPVIGFASMSTLKYAERFLTNVRKGLAEHGYVEGQNFRFEFREANFQADLMPILFRELVDQKVTLIVTATTLQTEAAKAATQSIPIVMGIGVDPVESGFVASLNKPGGNITGAFNFGVTLVGKQLEILHELVPSATKFAFLTDPGNATLSQLAMPLVQAAADSLGLSLLHVDARTPDEFEAAFDTAARGGAEGILLGVDSLFQIFATQLVAVAARYRLPTLFYVERAVKAGGLISYGPDQDEHERFLGRYAGRILKGEKPADLPVQQSTKTILIINLKTAKTLGITVPNSLLGRADEVIE